MKKLFTFFIFFSLLFSIEIISQSINENWSCLYSTYDDNSNGAGNNVISVGVISENEFVALVNRASIDAYFLVGYRDADSANGRLGNYPYGSSAANKQDIWSKGFDFLNLIDANDLTIGPDKSIYIASNDVDRNILTFSLGADTISSGSFRLPTAQQSHYLWSIDSDAEGRIYVSSFDETTGQSSVIVYDNTTNEPAWSSPQSVNPSPLQVIVLPDTGEARGVTVNSDGSALFVSNWDTKEVYKYVGSPTTGYLLDADFSLIIEDNVYTDTDTLITGPWGVQYMNDKNLLFIAQDADFVLGGLGYEYAKIFIANPFTSELIDTIDVAYWNYITLDSSYTNRPGGTTPGNASGYASTYYIDFDENYNVYSQSYFGWTSEKWQYDGELPIITSVSYKNIGNQFIPDNFTLEQNYPNPFNPATKIQFSVPETSNITLSVYNITGELIQKLIFNEHFEKGVYEVEFNAENLPSGVYIYTLNSGTISISEKMTLIK